MSDREISEKYVDLEKFCLTDKQKDQVMDMLYKYQEAGNRHMSKHRSKKRCNR